MPTPVTEHDTDLLAALVAAKLKILELLAQLARKQLALADRGESTDLLKLLAAKQTVLSQLQHIERRLDPFRSQDPEARVWRSPADRQRCQEQAIRCASGNRTVVIEFSAPPKILGPVQGRNVRQPARPR